MSFRKTRTRTLIQLGGLVEKSGLLSLLELNLGDDLQRDPECFESVATLMGALGEIQDRLSREDADTQKILWCERGKITLSRES